MHLGSFWWDVGGPGKDEDYFLKTITNFHLYISFVLSRKIKFLTVNLQNLFLTSRKLKGISVAIHTLSYLRDSLQTILL
jgi:hypothetical protein